MVLHRGTGPGGLQDPMGDQGSNPGWQGKCLTCCTILLLPHRTHSCLCADRFTPDSDQRSICGTSDILGSATCKARPYSCTISLAFNISAQSYFIFRLGLSIINGKVPVSFSLIQVLMFLDARCSGAIWFKASILSQELSGTTHPRSCTISGPLLSAYLQLIHLHMISEAMTSAC